MRNERRDSRVAVRFVQLAKVIGHRGVAQQLSHAIVMRARGFQKEPPKLSPLRIEHTEFERNSQKSFDRFDPMILVRFRNVLRYALQ